MILISCKNGSAIYIASSSRRIHGGPSVVRGRFPLEMILDAAAEIQTTYRFGPPPASGSAGSPSQGGMFVSGLKNGSRS
jgi:hypothetical protein